MLTYINRVGNISATLEMGILKETTIYSFNVKIKTKKNFMYGTWILRLYSL